VANALSTAPIISIADPNARKGLGEQLSETVETLAILNIQLIPHDAHARGVPLRAIAG